MLIRQYGQQGSAVFDTKTKVIWSNQASNKVFNLRKAGSILKNTAWLGLSDWHLPSDKQLVAFARASNNPVSGKAKYNLRSLNGDKSLWHCSTGIYNLNSQAMGLEDNSKKSASLFAINNSLRDASTEQILVNTLEKNWQLKDPYGEILKSESLDEILPKLVERGYYYPVKSNKAIHSVKLEEATSMKSLMGVDYRTCRLPQLEESFLKDSAHGMWELWGASPEFLKEQGLVARDPYKDIQRRAVTIDFGTSSTVVATENQHGNSELLRIGVRDFYQKHEAHHYENPTVLEFLDFDTFSRVWSQQAYRPELDWDWVRASHEAQASFRDNPGDTEVLASILPRLKQWALRNEKHQRICLTGRKGKAIELPPHTERNPVRGQALDVSGNDPLDPIELYAWYLGMTINWRKRGLFLNYYLSFPVKYPLEVKNRILASFRRGLQRSFPQTLIEHYPQVLQEFEVLELASEPAAYAAAALPHLGVEPTDEGVPYAVFDFGGGTSDFDFGIWRWATDDEDAKGYESVFEHYASSGDNYLGGENLLEHLVFETFKQNLDALRENRVQFIKPMDALDFPGCEPFIAPTQAAQTNAVMLAAKLRPFLESDKPDLASQLKLDLINAQGKKVTCELLLDAQLLDAFLRQRIERGWLSFLSELKKVATEFPADAPIQLLFAGNGSRSRHIRGLFANDSKELGKLYKQVFDDTIPPIEIHEALPADIANPYAPTSKTGVALGLLLVSPGKNVLLTNRLHEKHEGEAPFGWYVGRLRRNQLAPSLMPSSDYQQWQEVGPIQEGVFYLYYSTSPRTELGLKKGDSELKMQRLDLHEAAAGSKLFIRAIEPNAIELVAGLELPTATYGISKTLILE
ncbi:MAG: hypothetical protein GX029_11365 [Pseudomonadaceae bacterium]|nr:hypothetical protein [Pseudomonadaceae bacterium]